MSQRPAQDFSTRVNEASEAGEKFVELFYDTVDKRRQQLTGFYYEGSLVVWNGNPYSGVQDISVFYQSLPNSQHTIECFDCQPVLDSQGTTTVMVNCEGVVSFDVQPGNQHNEESFSQNFILVKQGDVWKLSSDCFRFLDALT